MTRRAPDTMTVLMAGPDGPQEVKVHSLRYLAELLNLHPTTVAKRVSAGLWPYTYVGSWVYFTEDQVQRIVEAHVRVHDFPVHEPGEQ